MNRTPATKRVLVPDVRDEGFASAEIRVGPDVLDVTLHLPDVAPGDAELVVTRYTIRVRRRSDPTGRAVSYGLPMAAEPGRFVARHRNGVWTILVQRAHRSH